MNIFDLFCWTPSDQRMLYRYKVLLLDRIVLDIRLENIKKFE